MASRATKSVHVGMHMYPVSVSAVQQLTPHLRRITLADDSLLGFRDDGPDQRFKLLLPRPGQREPIRFDTEGSWYQAWLTMPTDVRPVLRTYTVRAARPEAGEIDVDMLTHGDTGPGSAWASAAQPGDRVAVFGAWAEYDVDPSRTQLILGDHSALPAIAAIVERMGPETAGQVFVEVPSADEQLPLTLPDGVRLCWLDAAADAPGSALLAAVQALPDDARFAYAWVAADQATVRVVRRHLVRERGLAPEDVMFMGYWRTDGAIDGTAEQPPTPEPEDDDE